MLLWQHVEACGHELKSNCAETQRRNHSFCWQTHTPEAFQWTIIRPIVKQQFLKRIRENPHAVYSYKGLNMSLTQITLSSVWLAITQLMLAHITVHFSVCSARATQDKWGEMVFLHQSEMNWSLRWLNIKMKSCGNTVSSWELGVLQSLSVNMCSLFYCYWLCFSLQELNHRVFYWSKIKISLSSQSCLI